MNAGGSAGSEDQWGRRVDEHGVGTELVAQHPRQTDLAAGLHVKSKTQRPELRFGLPGVKPGDPRSQPELHFPGQGLEEIDADAPLTGDQLSLRLCASPPPGRTVRPSAPSEGQPGLCRRGGGEETACRPGWKGPHRSGCPENQLPNRRLRLDSRRAFPRPWRGPNQSSVSKKTSSTRAGSGSPSNVLSTRTLSHRVGPAITVQRQFATRS